MEKKRSLSLMQKMTLWFILIILLPSCVLSVVLCRALTDRAYDILVEDHYAVLGIARESISRSAASVESMVEMLSLNAELNKLLTDSKQTPYQRVVKILFDVGDTVAQAQLMLSGLDARVTLFSEDERIPETYWNFLRLKRLDSLPQYERFLLAGETRGWGGIGPVYPTETVLRPAGNPQMLCYYQKLLAGFGECVGVIQCGVSPQKIFSSLQIEGNADVHYYVFQGGEVIYQFDAEQALPEEYRPEESRQIIRRQLYLSRPLESMGLSLVMRLDYGQLHQSGAGERPCTLPDGHRQRRSAAGGDLHLPVVDSEASRSGGGFRPPRQGGQHGNRLPEPGRRRGWPADRRVQRAAQPPAGEQPPHDRA